MRVAIKKLNHSPCHLNAAKTAALMVALVVAARFMSLSMSSCDHASLGWVALVPLFIMIRAWRPVLALLGGALWGACLFAFLTVSSNSLLSPSWGEFLLLTWVPAVYVSLASWLTRRVGFSPLVLGVGWLGVELALAPANLNFGLSGILHPDGSLLHEITHALGSALVGFIIAYVNAAWVQVAAFICVCAPRSLAPRPAVVRTLASQSLAFSPSCHDRPCQPRAPPPIFLQAHA